MILRLPRLERFRLRHQQVIAAVAEGFLVLTARTSPSANTSQCAGASPKGEQESANRPVELNYFDITTPACPRLGGIAPDAALGAAFRGTAD